MLDAVNVSISGLSAPPTDWATVTEYEFDVLIWPKITVSSATPEPVTTLFSIGDTGGTIRLPELKVPMKVAGAATDAMIAGLVAWIEVAGFVETPFRLL